MSESVKAWFRTHFIHVAETYGGALTSVPLEEKGKKVQILEFLTFGSENDDSVVWALISDKFLSLPVKFSKEAVIECNKKLGRRLTECKTALVTIKKFKIISTRVPSRRDLDSDMDLREWSHGLRKDGGAGNVLKERKRDREAKIQVPHPPRNVPAHASTSLEPMDAYRKLWHDKDPVYFVRAFLPPRTPRQPSPEPQDARDLGSSSPSEKYSRSSSPVSGWSPTPAMSSPIKGMRTSSSPSPKPSSYLTAPTPAQRRFKSPAVSMAQRKVARPPSPPPVGSGPARILVPDSDTSQSQSLPSHPYQASQPSEPLQQSQPSEPLQQSQRSEPLQNSQPSQQSVILPQPIKEEEEVIDMLDEFDMEPMETLDEDIEILDEDDAQTEQRLFRRRGSSMERAEPAKKRRMDRAPPFSLGLDYVESARAVGWERVLLFLKRL
ncbi:hypothetical protein B0H17DRAFT_1042517 [Mycena rosella]|uniref:Telomere replication protein EST3 n=1 Tax=Mycena rosella TaxID=1033263 RepID=A0AAD7GNT4_MYCRO|nr:hypothetical protein B0H17DRAFT_1042517 [Mycena rosella]